MRKVSARKREEESGIATSALSLPNWRTRLFYHAILLLLALSPFSAWAHAQEIRSAPLHYLLDLREPATHLVKVTMDVPHAAAGERLQFPAWNNLYQIRDFVRDVQHLSARCDGRPVSLRRVDLDTWSSPIPCADLELSYQVYANQDDPFSSALTDRHAFLNFALLLFYLPQERGRPARVGFILPDGWKLATLLADSGTPGEYEASDYDHLVDSPAEAGHFREYDYTQSGATYRVIVDADPGDYSARQLLKGLEKITASETTLMQDVPFDRYTFIFHFPYSGRGGGMEHRDGTAISIPADQVRSGFIGVEATAAHEFFHLWNVKRIRPQALEPIDYVHGNATRDLWFSEGVTSTYGELTLLRAGLISRKEFYRHLASSISELESRPARFYQSAETSGREAWLEKYPDYFRPDRSISYYNKGELLGELLDLGIRHASENHASLDELMRYLNINFARRGRFFTESDLRRISIRLAPDFPADEFFQDYVEGTRELDYATYLGYAGLGLKTKKIEGAALGFKVLKSFEGPVRVESVEPDTSAARAGLKPGDVLVKMDGFYLTSIPERELGALKPGQQVFFTVERQGRRLEITFPLESKPTTGYEVVELKHPTRLEHAVREGWLTGKTQDRREEGN